MSNTNNTAPEAARLVGQSSMPRSSASTLSAYDARLGLAKLELSELENWQARWALARGSRSTYAFSSWTPALLPVLFLIAGSWIADTSVAPGDTVTRYLAYAVSALAGLVFFLVWTVRTLDRRLNAIAEIIDQKK